MPTKQTHSSQNRQHGQSWKKRPRPHTTEQTKFDKWLLQCQQDETPIWVVFPLDLQPILGTRHSDCKVITVDRYFIQLQVIAFSDSNANIFWFPKDVLRAVRLGIE